WDARRGADILADPNGNGIDYVEVDPADHRTLRVFFLRPLPPQNAADPNDPADAYGITADLTRVTVAGGTRVVGVPPTAARAPAPGSLEVRVQPPGDFSVYTLTIDVAALDPFLRRVPFSFMAACPVDFDCRRPVECPPAPLDEPLLDYLA